jgi:cyclic beta-1,2-glucan synthetase
MAEPSSQPGSSRPGQPPTSLQLNSPPTVTDQENKPPNPPESGQPYPETTSQQLEYRARSLAEAHLGKILPADQNWRTKSRPSKQHRVKPIYAYLPQYQHLLEEANRRFRGAKDTELGMSVAAEWMLDNAYIVLQALREVRIDLPPQYYYELPYVTSGILQGYPRVYAVAHDLIQHENTAIDADRIKRYIRAYQALDQSPDLSVDQIGSLLSMGELWALPTMLRLGIIENLAYCVGVLTGQIKHETAWHVPMVKIGKGLNGDQIVANCVLSLRGLAAQDWKVFFEETSLVEEVLKSEAAGIYPRMDFETRDQYRKAIEQTARLTGQDERKVARQAVNMARGQTESPSTLLKEDPSKSSGQTPSTVRREAPSSTLGQGFSPISIARRGHVGYFLLDKGRSDLEQALGYQPSLLNQIKGWLKGHPSLIYLGSIGLVTGLLVGAAGLIALNSGQIWQAALAMLLLFVPALTAAVDAVNWVVTHTTAPHRLPKMDFTAGIPEEYSTLVVVPAMLSSVGEIKSLLQQLELHYLRNPDLALGFALLTDFGDAAQKNMAGDEDLLEIAVEGVQTLIRRYKRHFFLFHRERLWNPSEGVWMGWERKRGKLHELNQMILGSDSTSFIVKYGELSMLKGVRYVITLDADTILPKDSAARLVATLAHPLNHVEFNNIGEIAAGYTILQPRTEISPTSANRSLFTRLFTGAGGLDLYTLAVSDVYQDLFGEGIYVGKGIYDVAGFERSLEGIIPENALLSHDLFEGIMGRAGLVTDIMLVEDFPANYLVHARRQTRWVRGDWQLLPWLLGVRTLSQSGPLALPSDASSAHTDSDTSSSVRTRSARRLSVISRWKIFDNLRRSLAEPALLLFFLIAWLWLPGSTALWTLAGALSLGVPVLAALLDAVRSTFYSGKLSIRWWSLTRRSEPGFGAAQPIQDTVARWIFSLVFLPYVTLLHVQAILVTFTRVYITHKHLLRWTTSAQSARHFGEDIDARVTWRHMVGALALSVAFGVLVGINHRLSLIPAAPLLAIWLISPEIALWFSQPARIRLKPLDRDQEKRLHSLARLTWLFFERFVGPEDHWLPPDHFQEAPLGIIAHRTSPTNIGLLLVSTLAAYDLGYVDLLNLGARMQSSLENLERMERYRGHFLNWFDTRSLTPLPPRYVSTVDSGNLAASLISLSQGLKTMAERPLFRQQTIQGLLDSAAMIHDLSNGFVISAELQPHNIELRRCLEDFEEKVRDIKGHPEAWPLLLRNLTGPGWDELDKALIELVEASAGILGADNLGKLRYYTRSLRGHLENLLREADLLTPWVELISQPPELFNLPVSNGHFAEGWTILCDVLKINLQLGEVDSATRTAQVVVDALRKSIVDRKAVPEVVLPADPENLHVDRIDNKLAAQALDWCDRMHRSLEDGRMAVKTLLIGFEQAARQADIYINEMDFSFLYDPHRQVFHIGYNVESGKLDDNYYDLLASEARLTSLVAIAKGDVPQSHWLHLARPLTIVGGLRVLLSWSATMFEYLMPLLLAPSYEGTLLQQSAQGVVKRQIHYGQEKGVPWGISESGYYGFDANQYYQYRAFGVPGLGYKRGVGDDLVVTPYASLLALPLEPLAVVKNLEALEKIGLMGAYGLYESVDFTPRRASLNENYHIVRSFMAHHQGMIFISLANFFTDQASVKRFHADARIQAVDLLLQERISLDAPLEHPLTGEQQTVRAVEANRVGNSWRARLQAPQPRVHFLSNGRYGVLVTSAGGGFSSWNDVDLTRWREDTTRSNWGTWVYIQDEDSRDLWSVGYQPTNVPTGSREVYFNAHIAELHRRDHDIAVTMEITVPPGDDLEVRMVSLTNHSERKRRLNLVSYGEVVLTDRETDRRHPAFNKLFIESEYVSEVNGLLFKRRPRSAADELVFLGHALVVGEGIIPSRAYESDRMRFLGRGRTSRAPEMMAQTPTRPISSSRENPGKTSLENQAKVRRDKEPTRPIPALAQEIQNQILERLGVKGPPPVQPVRTAGHQAMDPQARFKLSGTTGGTLDPIFALGQEIELEAHASCQVAFITIAAERRDEVLALARRYQSWLVIKRSFDQARLAAEVELRQLGLDTARVQVIERLLSLMLYPNQALRASPERLAANIKGQSGLWPFAISGDYPILLVFVEDGEELSLVQEVLQAHAYWRNRRLKIDLVIINEKGTDYGQELNRQIHNLLQRNSSEVWLNRRGGIFLLVKDQMNEAEQILIETAARAILTGKNGSLEAQLERMMRLPPRLPVFVPPMPEIEAQENTSPVPRPDGLLFDNGMGGFSPDGKEYVIFLKENQWTPAPWINVIANPDFGFIVSEVGSGSTWAENSGENRLTPWNNDPVCDQPGDVVYLRDEESGVVWSATPLPIREPEPYLVRHGAGYTTFEHNSHGLRQNLRLFASRDDPVKVVRLRLENTWSRTRRITVTYYVEWVLGIHRDMTKQYIVPEFDGESQALLARNAYNNEFSQRVAFAAASKKLHGLTADRTEFLGRLGGLFRPAALTRIGLASVVEAGRDPCAALQLHLDIPPGGAEEVYFLLGEGQDREDALRLVKLYQQADEVEKTWNNVMLAWDEILGTLQVSTPDPAMDILLNRWLLYQTLACRLWGRSALYQSSGAYGFRDQLQDAMALGYVAPQWLRAQILQAAHRQFEAGDVLHWWHPPTGRGVRTRISDDLLWLPYVTSEYIQITGDEGILEEKIPFIKAPPLEPGEVERYNLYPDQTDPFTLYEHCLRALKKGGTRGPHGLPLMGSGDWNDGMNLVGAPALKDDQREGRGESIWLGWFLFDTLNRFAKVCENKGDLGLAAQYRDKAEQYHQAIEKTAWDGAWYLRAFYDDGTPLGSASQAECKIDSIAESWGVISGGAEPQRARQAMQSVLERLVIWDEKLLLLFSPPFDVGTRNPGYIKGYLPGIRENGGQYTHAAIWTAWAVADLGDGDTAARLFSLLNPISHSADAQQVRKYRVDPYTVAADIYSEPPHTGRGGWTWYTGSAGWMYRLGVERLLGLKLQGASLRFDPCIPKEWKEYRATFHHCGSEYQIMVENPQGVCRGVRSVELDGKIINGDSLQFDGDSGKHKVRVIMGREE